MKSEKTISESELVLNQDGSVYHLQLLPEEIADNIIVVGDQDRVAKVSKYFDSIEVQKQHREFITHTGSLNNRRITVISTGIGPDNVEIVMTEMDALVNIDLHSRREKTEKKSLNFVRIGTSGAMQPEIELNSLLVSVKAVGFDNLFSFYDYRQSEEETAISSAMKKKLNLAFNPYCASASGQLMDQLAGGMLTGNTLTCPGFYVPQGREIRLNNRYENYLSGLMSFTYKDFRLSNFEMETAAYYALGKLLGHKILSCSVILANRATKKFSKDADQAVEKLIRQVLEKMTSEDFSVF